MNVVLDHIGLTRGGTPLVSGLTLTLSPGQCLWLKGPNGSGKTTFLEFIAGIYPPQSGTLSKNGHTFFLLSTIPSLDPKLTVEEHLTFWGQCLNNEKNITRALSTFSLQPFFHKTADQLSWGQKKRLMLSLLCLVPHTIWLLDEPFTGLDSTGRENLVYLCQQHLKDQGIIITAHHEAFPFKAHQELCFPALKENPNTAWNRSESWVA